MNRYTQESKMLSKIFTNCSLFYIEIVMHSRIYKHFSEYVISPIFFFIAFPHAGERPNVFLTSI